MEYPQKKKTTISLTEEGFIDLHLNASDIAAITALQDLCSPLAIAELTNEEHDLLIRQTQPRIAVIIKTRIDEILSKL